jgi:hypothetical protein
MIALTFLADDAGSSVVTVPSLYMYIPPFIFSTCPVIYQPLLTPETFNRHVINARFVSLD